MEKSGILSLVKLSKKESKLYLEYLRKSTGISAYDFIHYLIGEEYLKFLDLLAGTSFKIPSHKNLFRDLEMIKIYYYVREKNFTEESIKNAAKIFNKKVSYVKRSVNKISSTMDDCYNKRRDIDV